MFKITVTVALPFAEETSTAPPSVGVTSSTFDQRTVLRFWTKVDTSKGADGCWRWRAFRTHDGYGTFKAGGKKVRAHRFAHELLIGPIPALYVVDHVKAKGCKHRDCVNPSHLEAVPQPENVRRAFPRSNQERHQ